jgi:hypothetical protein
MNNLSWNVCGFFENLTIKLIFHWSLIKKASVYTRPLCICGMNWLNIYFNEKIFETRFQGKLKTFFIPKVLPKGSSLKTQFHSTVLDYVKMLKIKQSHYRPDRH